MASVYNPTRTNEQFLKLHAGSPPSLSVHLHQDHWRFNQSGHCLYHTPIASLLEDIRARRLPVDFLSILDQTGVPWYDGCLIVEIYDHRDVEASENPAEPVAPQRVVLRPTPESMWSDLCSLNSRLNAQWTDEDALDIEARILAATSAPLCLDPDPIVTRIANAALRATTPARPLPFKRKAAATEKDGDEAEKAYLQKLAKMMNPRADRVFRPTFNLLNFNERRNGPAFPPPEMQPPPTVPQPQATATPTPNSSFTPSSLPAPLPSRNSVSLEEDDKSVNGARKKIKSKKGTQGEIEPPEVNGGKGKRNGTTPAPSGSHPSPAAVPAPKKKAGKKGTASTETSPGRPPSTLPAVESNHGTPAPPSGRRGAMSISLDDQVLTGLPPPQQQYASGGQHSSLQMSMYTPSPQTRQPPLPPPQQPVQPPQSQSLSQHPQQPLPQSYTPIPSSRTPVPVPNVAPSPSQNQPMSMVSGKTIPGQISGKTIPGVGTPYALHSQPQAQTQPPRQPMPINIPGYPSATQQRPPGPPYAHQAHLQPTPVARASASPHLQPNQSLPQRGTPPIQPQMHSNMQVPVQRFPTNPSPAPPNYNVGYPMNAGTPNPQSQPPQQQQPQQQPPQTLQSQQYNTSQSVNMAALQQLQAQMQGAAGMSVPTLGPYNFQVPMGNVYGQPQWGGGMPGPGQGRGVGVGLQIPGQVPGGVAGQGRGMGMGRGVGR
ncbi:hypothetical protein BOTBODRAFT_63293 [Botryobasidium botryosum FD-172 SS1]|uniref:Spt20-like SEP domain-containing protein n=1 Tax=Botryobasidium botryosum (strain FD-172 SS1) TaxID=930990 RepID=A0A067N5X6_BOTB1|nr:hypothetical protein BOTBODRAFT_63293 [Botryobasidium botryosum FD-172 SS1]